MRHKAGQVIDHYEVLEALGEGAYAEVYRARDTATGRIVVLKSPDPLLFSDPQVYQRFTRESKIAQKLDHPGLQHALELREDIHEPYLVLEYVEGETLRQRIREFDNLVPLPLAMDWARQLADALCYMHSQGITHRDLKPENVLVGAGDALKIADFGSAMLEGARRLTWRHFSESVGTPDYMSPEQIQGDRGDPRSDIYSWGVVVYELLTGDVPFGGDNWLAVMAGHLRRAPRPIREQRPEVSPALEAVVLHAMRRYPKNRYQSAEELVLDLERLDTLDPKQYDLSPESPMGGMAAIESKKQLWLYVAAVAAGFFALLALIIIVTVVTR
ncbi:MAG TPA: serine/threonine-protein kinase [Coriobacteriia bacterium]